MNNREKDPFEQFDHLFDKTDQKYHPDDVKQKATKKTQPKYDDSDPNNTSKDRTPDRKKAASIFFWIVFSLILFNVLPLDNMMYVSMIFPFFFIIFIISIIIKASKR